MATADETQHQRLDTEEILHVIESDDPHGVYGDAFMTSIAQMGMNDCQADLSRVKAAVKESDSLNGNDFSAAIKKKTEEIVDSNSSNDVDGQGPPPVEEPDEPVYWEDVEDIALAHFDQHTLNMVEAVCANIVVLTFDNNASCPMLFLEGPSSSKKTTVLQMTEGTVGELVQRVDSITSASFVTHSTDQADDEVGENDLLPMLRHRVLSVREMSTFFSGDADSLREIWSTLASVADGDGFEKATGSQGLRGYSGDYRFAFQGATTPLGPVAWNVMGNIGGRVLFHEAKADHNVSVIKRSVYSDGIPFDQMLGECRKVVSGFLRTVWHQHADGYASVNWESGDDWIPEDEVQNATVLLAKLVSHSRTPANDYSSSGWKVSETEDYWRVTDLIKQISRAAAFMRGSRRVEMKHMELATRVALSTMPAARRPYVRMLIDPETNEKMTTQDVMKYADVSKPTAIKYMRLMDQLGIGDLQDIGEGQKSEYLIWKDPEFSNIWTTGLPFPDDYF